MMSFGSKYSPAGRLAALFILIILAVPCLTAPVDVDGCCGESTCCNYVSCDCNCNAVAGLISNPEPSPVVSLASSVAMPTPILPTEDLPRRTDHPPRLTA